MNNKIAHLGYLITFSLLVSATSFANEAYKEEVSLQWTTEDIENQGTDYIENDIFELTGKIYFSPVENRDHPLAEAAYLQRVGSVAIAGYRQKNVYNLSTVSPLFFDEESVTRGGAIQATYMQPDKPFMFQASYQSDTTDAEDQIMNTLYEYEEESSGYGISLGYFLSDSFLLGISYGDYETTFDKAPPLLPENDETTETRGLYLKYVDKIASGDAFNIESGIIYYAEDDSVDTEKYRRMSLAGDYYPNQAFSIGVEYNRYEFNQSNANVDSTGVRSTYFISPMYAVSLAYSETDYGTSPFDDAKEYKVGLSARF